MICTYMTLDVHTGGMVIKQEWRLTRRITTLHTWGWNGGDQQRCHKRQDSHHADGTTVQMLEQLHSNNIDIENRTSSKQLGILDKHDHRYRRHSRELLNIPWISTDTDKLWEMIGTNISMINNSNFLCAVDYHSKVPVVKRTEKVASRKV